MVAYTMCLSDLKLIIFKYPTLIYYQKKYIFNVLALMECVNVALVYVVMRESSGFL